MFNQVHVVKNGDTLWGISHHYNVNMALLVSLNNLRGRKQHALQIGQEIKLPDSEGADADTELTLRILDLSFRPINRAKLKLEYDGKTQEVVGDTKGEVGPIQIDDHAKGLKAHFRGFDGQYALIADHKTLPLGRKRLTLTSRTMLVRGNYMYESGAQRQANDDVRRDVKRTNSDRHIEPGSGSASGSTTGKSAPRSSSGSIPRRTPTTTPKPTPTSTPGGPNVLDQATKAASSVWDWLTGNDDSKATRSGGPRRGPSGNGKTPTTGGVAGSAGGGVTGKAQPVPVNKQTRVEGGQPTHVVGAVFAAENLKLAPSNEKYRKIITDVAKRHGMTPQALAAVINAEAAKDYATGEWKADSRASTSSASGLTQFLDDTFLELATERRSMVNQKLKRERGYEEVNPAYTKNSKDERVLDYIYGKIGDKKIKIDEDDVLPLRFNPEYSIDAGAVYALKNIATMNKLGINSSGLQSEELAKLMYMAHHEGAGGAIKIIKGTLTEERAMELLPKQVPNGKKRAALLKRFDNNCKKAYIHWLNNYTDSMINVLDFMVKPGTFKPRTMAEVSVAVNGAAPAKPAPKAPTAPQAKAKAKAKQQPAAPGGARATGSGTSNGAMCAAGWRNPLDVNQIRSAKLATWRAATFGMVRANKTKAHQGIDLKAVPGTPVYSVASGKVVSVYRGFKDKAGFGATVVLCVDVEDLPKAHKKYYLAKRPNDKVVYFAYCHLSSIDIKVGKDGTADVEINTKLGETGASGNAVGMNTIASGAHLHFEARYQHPLPAGRTGLKYRVDPRPFLVGVPDPS